MRFPPSLARPAIAGAIALLLVTVPAAQSRRGLDRTGERWVSQTLRKLTLEQKIGQLLSPSFFSTYVSTDSETVDTLARLVRIYHVGGVHVFGGRQRTPSVLLNNAYGAVTLGTPLDAASLLNRLQAMADVPILASADFEAGVGFRLEGATVFPRAMAFGAARDERLAFEAGRITALEGRAIGVHVNFAPVADVNNNPRNPVINTRSFGEDPEQVGALAAAYVRGLEAGGMIATLKHFPGHGDTDVDTHVGLAAIQHPRDRLERLEWMPFRAGIAAGAGAIMTSHIETPALDPAEGVPATFSQSIVTDVLRRDLAFQGLLYTDSMSMNAVTDWTPPGEAAVRALQAGHDVVLHPPDDVAAFEAVKAAVARGEIPMARIEASVERLLAVKARLGLHARRGVVLEAVPSVVGTRAHAAVAREVSQRSITLVRDERSHVPLRVPREAAVLYLSVLDYPSGWGIGAPSRTVIPELRRRWPNVTAIELSDRTTPAELDLVRASAGRHDAIVASVFVRTASGSRRMDLAPSLAALLNDLGRRAGAAGRPFVAVLFGNPYVASILPDVPAVILTYDFYDLAEESAVRALAGEAAIGGRLPIALPEVAPLGHGLERPAPPPSAAR